MKEKFTKAFNNALHPPKPKKKKSAKKPAAGKKQPTTATKPKAPAAATRPIATKPKAPVAAAKPKEIEGTMEPTASVKQAGEAELKAIAASPVVKKLNKTVKKNAKTIHRLEG